MRRESALVRLFDRLLERWFLPLVQRWGLSPNGLSVTGLVLNALAGLAYLLSPVPAALLALSAGLCDAADGLLARNSGRAGPQGAFVDSVLDRYGESFLLLGAWAYLSRFPAYATWGTVAVFAALVGSFMVSYTRARGEGLALSCQSGIFQRAERLLVLVVGSLLDPLSPGLVLLVTVSGLALGANLTAINRFRLIRARLSAGDLPPEPAADAEDVDKERSFLSK